MIVGIIPGTFSPPTHAHKIMAQQALDFTDCQEIWLVTNNAQGYYGLPSAKDALSPEDRFAMTELIATPPGIVASRIEIDYKTDGTTIQLINHLPPENKYALFIGSDHLKDFKKWVQWEKVDDFFWKMYVFERWGHPSEGLLLPKMEVVRHPLFVETNLSSSIVRARAESGLSIKEFVPEAIYGYLTEHNLLRQGRSGRSEALG